jgi:hypothetical protein
VVGECAYFVFRRRLFRYGLVDGQTQLIKQLPRDRALVERTCGSGPNLPLHQSNKFGNCPNKKLKICN